MSMRCVYSAAILASGLAAGVFASSAALADSNFGAIAYDQKNGAYGITSTYMDRERAEGRARAECGVYGDKDKCEIVVSFQGNECAALAEKKNVGGVYAIGKGATIEAAEAAAAEACDAKSSAGNCHVIASRCAAEKPEGVVNF
jgi:hypothetical protein